MAEKQLVFIDDSGDPGFRGATSPNFVMAAAVFVNKAMATKLNKAISDFRRSLGWQEGTEFKFRKTNKRIIKELLGLISGFDFDIYAVYVDKTSYKNMLSVIDQEKLYNWTIKELLKRIPLNEAIVKIDGRSDRQNRRRVASYLRREVNVGEKKIAKVGPENSVNDNLIQLADLIAGAINRSMLLDKTDAKEYISIIESHIVVLEKLDLGDK